MAKDNRKTRWETYKIWDLVRFILEVLWYVLYAVEFVAV